MSSSFTPSDAQASSSSYAAGPPSPEAPPYSPISPVATELPQLSAPLKRPPRPTYMTTAPAPEPIDESSNPDAIALRAAISVLQVQRQRALGDLQTLESQRDAAAAHPEEFARAVAEGRVRARESTSVLGGGDPPEDSSSEEDETTETEQQQTATGKKGKKAKEPNEDQMDFHFDQIPTPQSVVRCPPINWSKYHVAGEALDKLHQEQQTRPDSGLPYRDPTARAPVHQVAAPYSPWKDTLTDTPVKGRNEAKRG